MRPILAGAVLAAMVPVTALGQTVVPSGVSARLGVGPAFPDEVALSYCDGTKAISAGAAAVWDVGRFVSVEAGVSAFGRAGDADGCVVFAPCLPDAPCPYRDQYGPGLVPAYLAVGAETDLGDGVRPLFRVGVGRLVGEGQTFFEWKVGARLGDRPGSSLVLSIARMGFRAVERVRNFPDGALLDTRKVRVSMARLECAYEWRHP